MKISNSDFLKYFIVLPFGEFKYTFESVSKKVSLITCNGNVSSCIDDFKPSLPHNVHVNQELLPLWVQLLSQWLHFTAVQRVSHSIRHQSWETMQKSDTQNTNKNERRRMDFVIQRNVAKMWELIINKRLNLFKWSPLKDVWPPPSIPWAAVLTACDREQTMRSSGKRGTPREPSNSGAGRARWGPTPDREIWGASGWRTTRYPSSCLKDRQLSSLKHLAKSQRQIKNI